MLPLLGLSHLDRAFDYRVDSDQDIEARPGVRVRVRFAGRLVDGFLLERRDDTDHAGTLAWLDRVVSPEPVLTPEIARLARATADRYAGSMGDVLRLAIPPRHARTESAEPKVDESVGVDAGATAGVEVDLSAWDAYDHADRFAESVVAGAFPRAVWQAAPGEDWPARLAELAAVTVRGGRGVVVVVPDQRDLDRVAAATEALLGDRVVALSAGLGPSARYRRWLRALRGHSPVVIGTRSAVFAPVPDVGLVVIWDDGDPSMYEPRSPYPHPREVGVLRSHGSRCGLLIGGFARTAEAHTLVTAGWAHDLLPRRTIVRDRTPRVTALSDEDRRVARDPLAMSARIPGLAFDAARAALAADTPVLFSVPRRGYLPSLLCARCREPARCRHCHGPLQSAGPDQPLTCRWCGRADPGFRCAHCGSTTVRAGATGARRTAEELGRAFPGVPVLTSGGDRIADSTEPGARVVVATPGAEPWVAGGYGAAVLLDTWAQLDRAELRAGEDAVRRWLNTAALVRGHRDGGTMVIVADAGLPVVQAVIRWDPVGFAEREVLQRAELGFPPAVTMAAVDGDAAAVVTFTDTLELPPGAERLGPVALPPGARPPAGSENRDDVERVLVRVDRRHGRELAAALQTAQAIRGAHHDGLSLRVQVDPPDVG
nr:primosomal protein N' [Williamsia sterculiae]